MNLKHLRTEKGLSQQQLATKLNVSRSTVAMWEAGSSEPNMQMIREISRVLGVPINAIFGESVRSISPKTKKPSPCSARSPRGSRSRPSRTSWIMKISASARPTTATNTLACALRAVPCIQSIKMATPSSSAARKPPRPAMTPWSWSMAMTPPSSASSAVRRASFSCPSTLPISSPPSTPMRRSKLYLCAFWASA